MRFQLQARRSIAESKRGQAYVVGVVIKSVPEGWGWGAKGQIISECPHEIILYPKIATKNFLDFYPSL